MQRLKHAVEQLQRTSQNKNNWKRPSTIIYFVLESSLVGKIPGFAPCPYDKINSYMCSPGTQKECGFYLWYTEFHGSNNQSYNITKVLEVFTDDTEGVSDIFNGLAVPC